ncbi:transglycosylase SLT domain-containing protein [Anoxybacillus flavithermus]|nr:transglycosylase SLT domain-containing protein [Anoxybacillus flavithermus]
MLGQIKQFESITENLEQLDQLSKLASQSLTQVGTSQEKLSESQDKANKSTEKSIYIADKYKQALEKVNTELEKINAIKSKFPQHSKEYQKALKQEIELLKQQKKIYEDQTKDLQRQIKSGKIQQTGIITQKSTSNSVYTGQYADIINKAAKTYGIDPFLIAAVIKQESNFNPRAKSHTGAEGLMQLTPTTAKELGVTNPYDPSQNIMGGAKYLAQQLQRFGGNIEKALAAYNAGAGNVLKYGGIPPFKETQNYVKKVSQYYSQYSKTGTIDTSDVSRQKAEAQQAIDEAKIQVNQLIQQSEKTSGEITELYGQLVDSFIAEYEHSINYIQNKVKEYELKTQSLDETSEDYRSAINEQAYQLTMVNKKLNDEIWFLRHQATNNKNISQQKREELLSLAKEKELEHIENKLRIQDLLFEKVNSKLREYSDQIDDIDFELERSQKLMSVYNEESNEYQKELEIQNKLLRQKKKLLHQEAEYIRKQLKSEKLSAEQKRELKERIEEISLAWLDLENQIKSIQETIAGRVIDIFKKSYQKQKDFALEAINKEMDALEKAHQKKMKMYDEDLSRFEETVNKKIGLIDKQAEEEDYNKELGKLQNEQLELQKRISILSLDNSSEAKVKRLEMEKELATLMEQIEELKLGRERKLRKENLEEELETYRKEIEEKKEAEDKKYEIEKERLEKIRRKTEFHYDNLINDEQYYANIRKNIMEGNFNEIKRIMQTFYDEMKVKNEEVTREMGESWAELTNLMNEITSGQKQMSAIENAQISAIENTPLMMDWKKYLENKRKYNLAKTPQEKQQLAAENTALRRKYGFIDGSYEELSGIQFSNKDELRKIAWQEYLNNKRLYDLQKTQESKEILKRENEELRQFWGFPDGTYEQLKKLKVYHEGGIVGQDTTPLSRIFRKLMDLKPNEQIVKALKGEIMIPQVKLPNFIGNIQALSPTLATPGGNVANYYLTIHIDKLTGSKQDADNLSTTLINNLKKWGKY